MSDIIHECYYRILLQKKFLARKEKNHKYSLRAFARDLNIKPPQLSQILSGKKGLSKKTSLEIVQSLNLKDSEKELFLHSVVAVHARRKSEREKSANQFKKFFFESQKKTITPEQLQKANSWLHNAVLQLIDFKGCESVRLIADKLGIPATQVEKTITELKSIGWLIETHDFYKSVVGYIQTMNDFSSESIQNFHVSVMQKAQLEIKKQSLLEREFQSSTLSFNKKKLPEAKKFIRQFVEEFNEKFHAGDDKDSVYQLSLQFFCLTL